jgi:hypothetical protein
MPPPELGVDMKRQDILDVFSGVAITWPGMATSSRDLLIRSRLL